jgi:hypothetical protein
MSLAFDALTSIRPETVKNWCACSSVLHCAHPPQSSLVPPLFHRSSKIYHVVHSTLAAKIFRTNPAQGQLLTDLWHSQASAVLSQTRLQQRVRAHHIGIREMRARSRFRAPADSPLHDCTAPEKCNVRRESVGYLCEADVRAGGETPHAASLWRASVETCVLCL